MMNRIVLAFFILFSFSCDNSKSEINSIIIEFDGAKKEYYQKYNLWLDIKSFDTIQEILKLHSKSVERSSYCRIKPVMYEVDVFAGTKKNSSYIFTVGSNTEGNVNIYDRRNCYENDKLREMIIRLVKVEDIKNYPGELNQSEYDNILGIIN